MDPSPVSVFWFRRDLRVNDNHALLSCFKFTKERGTAVLPIFIFDQEILEKLPRDDHRVSFIHFWLIELEKEFRRSGANLHVYHGRPLEIFRDLFLRFKIQAVFTNEDYEPYAIKRDQEVSKLTSQHKAEFKSVKDQVLFAKDEVTKDDGSSYRMFTPYSRKWLAGFEAGQIPIYPSQKWITARSVTLDKAKARVPSLKELGFTPTSIALPQSRIHSSQIKEYEENRNFMNLEGTSNIGPFLRFGTISVRHCIKLAEKLSSVWLKELIWREFFQQILFHHPETVSEPFDVRFKKFPWRSLKEARPAADFAAWKSGNTGYPIVDAGMRELNATGFMHNRARMIVGSFLTKHLLIDWRHGERYFAEKLFDFELASNVGNWQWVAGTGCDAAPYFRIFNPALQAKKFDVGSEYVKKWVPLAGTEKYPEPLVDHEFARRRALTAYAKVKVLKK